MIAAPLASKCWKTAHSMRSRSVKARALHAHFSQQDIDLFAVISGDVNPAHMDPAYAKTDIFHRVIAQGMLTAGLISSVLGTKLPGTGNDLSRSGSPLSEAAWISAIRSPRP